MAMGRMGLRGTEGDSPALSNELLAGLSAAQGEAATIGDLAGLTQRRLSVKVDQHQLRLLEAEVAEEEVRERA